MPGCRSRCCLCSSPRSSGSSRQAERAENPQLRADRVGAIASLARNIGAMQLAQVARGLAQSVDPASSDGAADLTALRSAVMTTVAFIRRDGG